MSDLFRSAKSVLNRADHHITDLQNTVRGTVLDKPYTYRADRDPNTGKYLHKVVFSESFSDDISCIMFDAAINLRACLDQMTFAIASQFRGGGDFAQFPFASDADHWPARIKGLKNHIPPEIIAVFERFKPYKGGNDTLWALNYIANIKKHAILIPATFGEAMVTLPRVFAGSPSFEWCNRTFGDDNEIKLFLCNAPDLSADIQFSFTVVIRHPEKVIEGKEPVSFLNAIRTEVASVMTLTEAECRRLRGVS